LTIRVCVMQYAILHIRISSSERETETERKTETERDREGQGIVGKNHLEVFGAELAAEELVLLPDMLLQFLKAGEDLGLRAVGALWQQKPPGVTNGV